MTGSLVEGTKKALGKGLGTGFPEITALIDGTPVGALEVSVGSQVAYDQDDGQYYMGLTGTTWVKLGSIA